jgi:hypothetical protein
MKIVNNRRHHGLLVLLWQVVRFLMICTILATTTRTRRRLFSATALSQNNNHSSKKKIAIVGGGASGIFASIAASEHDHTHVTVLEATSNTLQKVKISGGGRCNVMHDTSKPTPTILSGYPRGNKELNGLFHKRFTPTMAREWFEYRGVELKTEG